MLIDNMLICNMLIENMLIDDMLIGNMLIGNMLIDNMLIGTKLIVKCNLFRSFCALVVVKNEFIWSVILRSYLRILTQANLALFMSVSDNPSEPRIIYFKFWQPKRTQDYLIQSLTTKVE